MDGVTFERPAPRILVVEPNPGAAEIIAEILVAIGCEIMGPCVSLEMAKRLMAGGVRIDGAVLEMAIGGSFTFELAESLVERRKPVVFFSRCGSEIVPCRLCGFPVLPKPQGIEWLADVAATAFFER
jgi:hypothetical protein